MNPELEELKALRDRLKASLDRALAGALGTVPLSQDDIKRRRQIITDIEAQIRQLEGGADEGAR